MIGIAKILVACEESQAVTKEFRAIGHEAFSCDIIPCSGGHPEWHIMGDCLPLLNGDCTFTTMDGVSHEQRGGWNLLIGHPPCTYLSNAATRSFSLRCTPAEKVVARWDNRARAAIFFMQIMLADCEHICVENPVGFMNSAYRKADQIIHPYYFAESEDDKDNYYTKRTCLWLKNLPPLERTSNLPAPEPLYICQGGKKKGKGIGWTEAMRGISGGQEERAKARSKTFPGIARAIATQYGPLLEENVG